jgi:hypothetical protein
MISDLIGGHFVRSRDGAQSRHCEEQGCRSNAAGNKKAPAGAFPKFTLKR